MQKKQALHCNAEAGNATQKFIISRYYTEMHKLQGLYSNVEVADTTL
jgi:hypothetical protein